MALSVIIDFVNSVAVLQTEGTIGPGMQFSGSAFDQFLPVLKICDDAVAEYYSPEEETKRKEYEVAKIDLQIASLEARKVLITKGPVVIEPLPKDLKDPEEEIVP